VSPIAIIPLIAWWAVSASADYVRGMALARQGRWAEARAAFESGAAKAPRDKRFPIELAGVAYREGSRSRAAAHLRRALTLDPADEYANEFLGTIYFLDGNTEAALVHWNRARRPRIESVRWEPEPRLDPVLADRALAFAPSEVLLVDQYRATRRRLNFLGLFTDSTIGLSSRDDGAFDAVVRAQERSAGWLSLARGLAFETVYAELPDIRGSGASLASMLRWDGNKRRAAVGFSAPLAGDPAWRVRLRTDARDENWNVPGAGEFNLRKIESSLDLLRLTEGGTEWSAGASVSSRTAPIPLDGSPHEGFALQARGAVRRELLAISWRQLSVSGSLSGALGRMFEDGAPLFGKVEAGIDANWRSLAARFRAGAVSGAAPFDELFTLGVDRDTEHWLRGRSATRDGKKGSGPIGRSFALASIEWLPAVWQAGFVTLYAGPFIDAGRAWSGPSPSSWLADPGLQAAVRLPGGPSVTVSWSRRTVFTSVSPLNW
jgi:hypothetical protein